MGRYWNLLQLIISSIVAGIPVWAVDEGRLQWHKDVNKEYEKSKKDPEYVCSSEYITSSCKFGPSELALQTPYRAGIAHSLQ